VSERKLNASRHGSCFQIFAIMVLRTEKDSILNQNAVESFSRELDCVTSWLRGGRQPHWAAGSAFLAREQGGRLG
jgi:hypothetical protein